jgi:thiamine-phosphate pyrophosphorylase
MTQPNLHVILDFASGAPDPIALAERVLRAGAPLIQLRSKGVTDAAAYEVASRIADLCRLVEATLVINDRADLALAVGAGGVHIGAEDLPVDVVRRLVGPTSLVGGTARNADRARLLVAAGASYLGVGPVYATTSKVGLPTPLGLSAISSVAAAVSVPVIAISGVTVERVAELVAAGAHGVAVIGAISRAVDPAAATVAFLRALERAT